MSRSSTEAGLSMNTATPAAAWRRASPVAPAAAQWRRRPRPRARSDTRAAARRWRWWSWSASWLAARLTRADRARAGARRPRRCMTVSSCPLPARARPARDRGAGEALLEAARRARAAVSGEVEEGGPVAIMASTKTSGVAGDAPSLATLLVTTVTGCYGGPRTAGCVGEACALTIESWGGLKTHTSVTGRNRTARRWTR